MIIQIIKLRSGLELEELKKRAREREPNFSAIPGLLQKYYVQGNEPNEYGGFYVWDSQESIEAFRQSDLAKSIPQAYEVLEPPRVESFEVLFQLRNP